jgi:hypothetical protein
MNRVPERILLASVRLDSVCLPSQDEGSDPAR